MNRASPSVGDLAAIAVCTLAWGTTWYAITLQFGVVEPIVSVVYRFVLASVLLLVWAAVQRAPMRLTRPQHLAAFGMGCATFAVQYPLVYLAEMNLSSAVVAVLFAAMSFVNLIMFRLALGQRAPLLSWAAACMGIAGVALLSWGELTSSQMDARAVTGLGLTLCAIVVASLGNVFARRAETAGAPVIASTAWAMLYGSAMLALYTTLNGAAWTFDARPTYVLSLVYLSLVGSVIAFLLYFGLARRRGFALASYISALTPLVAMVVSTWFEGKGWTLFALAGVAVIMAGQWLFMRGSRAKE